jgi:hypothetical protein
VRSDKRQSRPIRRERKDLIIEESKTSQCRQALAEQKKEIAPGAGIQWSNTKNSNSQNAKSVRKALKSVRLEFTGTMVSDGGSATYHAHVAKSTTP